MFTFITIPNDFISNVGATASGLFSDFAPVAILICGTFLGMIVIDWLVGMFRRKDENANIDNPTN